MSSSIYDNLNSLIERIDKGEVEDLAELKGLILQLAMIVRSIEYQRMSKPQIQHRTGTLI